MKRAVAMMLCLLLLLTIGGCSSATQKYTKPSQPNNTVKNDGAETDDFDGTISFAPSDDSVISADTPVILGNTVYFNQRYMDGKEDGVYFQTLNASVQGKHTVGGHLLGGAAQGFFVLHENQLSFYEGERASATVSLSGMPELIYCGVWNDIAYFQDTAEAQPKLIAWAYRQRTEQPREALLPRKFAADWAFVGNTAYLWRESVAPDLELFALDLDTLECKYLENLSMGGKAVLHVSDGVLYIGTNQGLYRYVDDKLTSLQATEGSRCSFYQNSVYITDLETKATQSLDLKTLQPTDEIGEGQMLFACTKQGILLLEGDRLIWPQGGKEAKFKGGLSPDGYAVSDSFVAVTESFYGRAEIRLYPWK